MPHERLRDEPCPRQSYLFTSETVSEGHPDKVCDRISDAIVDAFLAADPESRVAVETLCTTNRVVLAGEVRGPKQRHPRGDDRRRAPGDQGHRLRAGRLPLEERDGRLLRALRSPPTSRMGVDAAGNKDEGAGDQGIMFGYA